MSNDTKAKTEVLAALKIFLNTLSQEPPFSDAAEGLILGSSYACLSRPLSDSTVQSTLSEAVIYAERGARESQAAAGGKVLWDLASSAPEIWIYERIAAAWIKYRQILPDGNESTNGAMLLSFALTENGWKVSGWADTQWQANDPSPPLSFKATNEVMGPIDALLSAFSNPDWETLSSWFLPNGGCTLIRPPASSQVMTFKDSIIRLQDILKSLPAGAKFDEKLHDVEVRTCGDLGFIWAPHTIEVNGTLRYSGTNIFSVLQRGDKWVLSGCQDYAKPISS